MQTSPSCACLTRCCEAPRHYPRMVAVSCGSTCQPQPSPRRHWPPRPRPNLTKEIVMETIPHATLDASSLPTEEAPRTAATVSAAILTERGLAEGYVALPLCQLMAQRVWASIETLNRSLTVLEHNSFTRMTSDWAHE